MNLRVKLIRTINKNGEKKKKYYKINVHVNEIAASEAPVAFIVHWKTVKDTIYRVYNDNFYIPAFDSHRKPVTAKNLQDESFLGLAGTTFEDNKAYILKTFERYLVIDGIFYEKADEPKYDVKHHHDSTENGAVLLKVKFFERSDDDILCGKLFSALEGEQAVAYANKLAADTGNTHLINTFKANIEVLMPELVKFKSNYKPIQKVAVTWEMCGYIEVEADSMEEAIQMVQDDPSAYSLPKNGEYVDDSFQVSSTDIEMMEAMVE